MPPPDGAAGSSPWASDGPEGAWWRGDPAATAARFAALHPTEPIPPAPTVTLAPQPSEQAPAAGDEPPMCQVPATYGRHTLPETLPEPDSSPPPADGEPSPPAADAAEPIPAERATAAPDGSEAGLEPSTQATAGLDPSAQAAAEPDPSVRAATDATEPDLFERTAAEPEQAVAAQPTDTDSPARPRDADPPAQLADSDARFQRTDRDPSARPRDTHPPSQLTDPNSPARLTHPDSAAQPTDLDSPTRSTDAHSRTQLPDPDPPAQPADPDSPSQPTEAEADASPAEPDTIEKTATEPEPTPPVKAATHKKHPKYEDSNTGALDATAEPETETIPATADPETALTQPIVVREARDARETARIAVPERPPATETEERPFWMPLQEMPRGSRRPPMRGRPGRPPKPQRRPATGLIALLVFALLATFFAWVSAEPLWLAVGHGDRGTATVTECTGGGVSQRCLGEFTAASGAFTAERVRLLGVGDQDGEGTTVAAKMVGSDSGRAYVDAASGVIHLRWGLGMGLVLLCGAGIVWATGSLRLETRRARRRATLAGFAGPLLVAVAFLAATF